MPGLDWGAIESARLVRDPFDHIAVRQVLSFTCAAAIPGEFPAIRSPGSYSLADAPAGPALSGLIEDLLSDRFRAEMARIFDVDLNGKPASITLRGQCSGRDGRIHIDSKSKVLSLLIYLNEGWSSPEGQLRLLADRDGFDTAPVEIPAHLGSMVAFRRSETSWHGHSPFIGQRRALQFNYLQSHRASVTGLLRHRLSAFGKQFAA
ncbi:2OG-Fe(II) oxygenase [Phenylobacterium sp.]|uniref:2OG-Fe(II) oxygenase n=1 Tax=Phenylobacterium sp. TaxID=1871053 RepID=UPI002CA256E8|nr:2OG-Fe(II) oxygenase [Phenylobacterium sp.]HLZ76676.1 2OG-Fe(II) oxygenase [Phenylobacterium sp.]